MIRSCTAPASKAIKVNSQHLIDLGHSYARVGLEAGALSPWLYAGLVEAGPPAICVETRHMNAALSARINKTDRRDGSRRLMDKNQAHRAPPAWRRSYGSDGSG